MFLFSNRTSSFCFFFVFQDVQVFSNEHVLLSFLKHVLKDTTNTLYMHCKDPRTIQREQQATLVSLPNPHHSPKEAAALWPAVLTRTPVDGLPDVGFFFPRTRVTF